MIEKFRLEFKKYTDRVDSLSLRERAIVFVAILVALYSLAANLLFPPLTVQQKTLTQQLAAKRQQIQATETQIQTVLTRSTHDPDAANRAKLAELESRLRSLDQSLATATARLVPPREMARMVEQIVLRNRNLTLARIESLPAEPLQLPVSGGLPAAGAMVYRHGMHIELRGGYLDILAYLRELENLPWKLFWGQVTLQTEQYPVSRLVLRVYTLSTREGWIGI
jgi:MSHA biogenesis protein MshJ